MTVDAVHAERNICQIVPEEISDRSPQPISIQLLGDNRFRANRVMVKFPAQQIGLGTSEEEQQRAEEESKQEKTSDVSPKQPTSSDGSDDGNPQGYVFGTCEKARLRAAAKRKKLFRFR